MGPPRRESDEKFGSAKNDEVRKVQQQQEEEEERIAAVKETPSLAQLLTAAGVSVDPRVPTIPLNQPFLQQMQQQQQQLQQQQQKQTFSGGGLTNLKIFNGAGGGGGANSQQPPSPSFWNQFYAQQALVGNLYGQNQQQQQMLVHQALSNGGGGMNINDRLSFLSNFSTGLLGQPTQSQRTQSSGGGFFDNEDLKEFFRTAVRNTANAGEITSVKPRGLKNVLTTTERGNGRGDGQQQQQQQQLQQQNMNNNKKNNNNNNNRRQSQPNSAQQPGSRGNSAFSPFANSNGDGGNNIFTTSDLRKVASLQQKKKDPNAKATSGEKKITKAKGGKGKEQQSKGKIVLNNNSNISASLQNQQIVQLAPAAVASVGGNEVDANVLAIEVSKLQQQKNETPEEREIREKKDAAFKMKQLSTRGHTTRAYERDELYKSIVDTDGNMLLTEVIDRFEANANKMTQLNKEYEDQKNESQGGKKKIQDISNIVQAAAQKITGASDDVMAKVRGILEEELSDAEMDIAEGDETGADIVVENDLLRKERGANNDNDKINPKSDVDVVGAESIIDPDETDIKVRSRAWTIEEDELVQLLVSQVGLKKWALIAGQLQGKTQKQAYARWRDYLQPGLTARPWTKWEEIHLLDCQRHIGNQWAVLARFMPGRSPNAIKNRFHATKRKQERTEKSTAKATSPVDGTTKTTTTTTRKELPSLPRPPQRKKSATPPPLESAPSHQPLQHQTKKRKTEQTTTTTTTTTTEHPSTIDKPPEPALSTRNTRPRK